MFPLPTIPLSPPEESPLDHPIEEELVALRERITEMECLTEASNLHTCDLSRAVRKLLDHQDRLFRRIEQLQLDLALLELGRQEEKRSNPWVRLFQKGCRSVAKVFGWVCRSRRRNRHRLDHPETYHFSG